MLCCAYVQCEKSVADRPVEAAAVRGGGEEQFWLAQGEALGDPRPDVPHLLGTDNLRGEVVRIHC